jgi:hypothetical protein
MRPLRASEQLFLGGIVGIVALVALVGSLSVSRIGSGADGAGNLGGSASYTSGGAYNSPNGLRGFLDIGTAARLAGWAYDRASPAAPVTIEVYVDGLLAQSFRTNVLRQDVNNAFRIKGAHGFDTVLTLPDAQRHRVVIQTRSGNRLTVIGSLRLEGTCVPCTQSTCTVDGQLQACAGGCASVPIRCAQGQTCQDGACRAPLSNGAQFVGQDVPATMVAGRVYPVTIVMRNTGTTIWRKFTGAGGGMHRLGSQSPENNGLFVPLTRVELPRDVAPGEEVAFAFTAKAPSEPGTYAFQWRMVEELKEWFGDKTQSVAVTVIPMPPPNQPVTFRLIDALSSDLNAVAMGDWTSMLTTVNGITYACYVDGAGRVVLKTSADGGASWSQPTILHTGNSDDAHNLCSVAIDPQGYVHMMYDMHGTPLKYKVSNAPYSIGSFTARNTTGTGEDMVTYPSFFTAPQGGFYLLHRYWGSGHGDLYLKRLVSSPATWQDVHIPLLKGTGLTPSDNAYWSNVAFDAAGNWHFAWVHRKSDGYNYNVDYARYNAALGRWERSDGTPYSLPITRDTAEVVLPTGPSDGLMNTGLNVVLDGTGTPHLIFTKQAADGYREVFHSAKAGGQWRVNQVTDFNRARVNGCVNDPDPGRTLPRPCDMEVGGPLAVMDAKGRMFVFVPVAIPDAQSRGMWARPPATLYWLMSADGGATWSSPKEIALPDGKHTNELPMDGKYFRQAGKLRLFMQTVDAKTGPAYLADIDLDLLATS